MIPLPTIETLKIEVKKGSNTASSELERLASGLSSLKTASSQSANSLNKVSAAITGLSNALGKVNTGDFETKLKRISRGLSTLKTQTEGLKVSSSIGSQLNAIGTAVDNIEWTDGGKLSALAEGLRPLSELGRSNLTSFINQLGKIPAVIAELDAADIGKFTQQMQSLAAAMKPFADEMQKVSTGFAAFPSRIQRLVTSTEQYNGKVKQATTHTNLWRGALKKLSALAVFRLLTKGIASAVKKSSEYTEVLNMFSVSMGSYAQAAYDYAKKVSEVMGIDPAEWMENQGVFNSIITGFGIAGDKAATMSKNLTQLGYDLASFYDTDFETAMQKVQSGISGELEPLRRWGYDLSVARLQQEALNLGISKSVSEMTQAEKAQLRYYAMMTQVTQVQGDMARTLDQPANQLRILKAQLEQASRAIGDLFIPMLNKILPVAIAVVSALREIINAIAALFGIEMADNAGFSDAEEATGSIADSVDNAADSAKKLKQYLAGFDELNVMPPASDSGSESSSGSSFDIPLVEYDFLNDATTARIDAIKAKLEPFVTWVKDNMRDILTIVGAIGIGILAWNIGKDVASFFNGLGSLGTSITPLVGVAVAVAGAFILIANAIDAIKNGVDWENLKGMIAGTVVIAIALGTAFGTVGAAIGFLIGGVVTLGVSLYDWIKTGELSEEALWGIQAGLLAIGAAISLLTGSWIPIVIAAIVGIAAEIYKRWDDIKIIIDNLVQNSKNMLNAIKAAVKAAFTWIGVFVKTILNGIITKAETTVNRIINGINGLLGGFNKVATWAGDVLGTNWKGVTLIPNITLPRLATGGFVDSGQMFIARENGMPEMVGSFGTHTAVANNQQITEGVARAVFDAMMDTGILSYVRSIADSSERTAQKDFSLGKPNSAAGRWVQQSVAAYKGVTG